MTDKKDESIETKSPDTNSGTLDDELLEKLAVEELMREAVQGAARAELVGPAGWVKTPKPKPNKRFIVNTIRQAVASNKYQGSSRKSHKSRNIKHSISKDRLKRN